MGAVGAGAAAGPSRALAPRHPRAPATRAPYPPLLCRRVGRAVAAAGADAGAGRRPSHRRTNAAVAAAIETAPSPVDAPDTLPRATDRGAVRRRKLPGAP